MRKKSPTNTGNTANTASFRLSPPNYQAATILLYYLFAIQVFYIYSGANGYEVSRWSVCVYGVLLGIQRFGTAVGVKILSPFKR